MRAKVALRTLFGPSSLSPIAPDLVQPSFHGGIHQNHIRIVTEEDLALLPEEVHSSFDLSGRD
jgi:hypothetical protein